MVAAMVVAAGCVHTVPPRDVVTETACKESQEQLIALGCPEGRHAGYMESCEQLMSLGYIWPTEESGPRCIVKATSVDEVRACNVRCEK